jgi:hypothetical protein
MCNFAAVFPSLDRNVQFRCSISAVQSKSNSKPGPEGPEAIGYFEATSKSDTPTIPVNLRDECWGDAISAAASQNRRLIGTVTALLIRWRGWGIGPHLTFLF